jgi:hypothetical protein
VEPLARGEPGIPPALDPQKRPAAGQRTEQRRYSRWTSDGCGTVTPAGIYLAVKPKMYQRRGDNPDRNAQFEYINNQAAKNLKRGNPVISADTKKFETIVKLISATTAEKGLKVYCQLNEHDYPTKIKVSNEEIGQIRLCKKSFRGEWNYDIKPHKE